MKIETYSYGKSFLLPDGNWDKYEVTISLDVNDDPDIARQVSREMIYEFFKKNNPAATTIGPTGEMPVIQVQKEAAEDRRIGLFSKDIESCTDLQVLDSYRLLIKDNLLLQPIYDKRRAELVAAETKDILERSRIKNNK